MSTQPQSTKPEEEKTYKCSDCDAWVKPSESCCGSDEEEESYIKKDGAFCHGCRTGGNEKCLCEEEDDLNLEECFNGHAGDCDAEYTFTLAKSRLLELITKDIMTDDSGEYKELEKYVMKIVGHIHLLELEDC